MILTVANYAVSLSTGAVYLWKFVPRRRRHFLLIRSRALVLFLYRSLSISWRVWEVALSQSQIAPYAQL
ncbi:hypothetical protein CPC08DRAFT_211706 [Agrocybe pediades]|nr:hypothetical protein CPC08DRAFT_211706 [Agrocybe pediades]